MSLKDVKVKIRAISKIHQVTKAMEAVSAVKMRRSQAVAIEMRPFALHAIGLLRRLVQMGATKNHALVKAHATEKTILMVVITSDRGLAGALNNYVLKAAHDHIQKKGWTTEQVKILAIGKKGFEYFSKRGFEIVDRLERWGEGVSMGDPSNLAQTLITKYKNHTYDRVMLVYSNFESTFSQSPVIRRLLPISFAAVEEIIAGIVPARGKYSELRENTNGNAKGEYIFEPNARTVLNELFPYLIGVLLYHAVLQANASEHSARMVAMKSASDRARDLTKELTLKFNKERQTSITAEVSEITSGIEAMR
jgi:F-type H+-transporting ATPase subunit gamma